MKTFLRVFGRHFIDQMDLHTAYVIITNVAG